MIDGPQQIITLDHDSILYKNSIKRILSEYNKLSDKRKRRIGILCINHENKKIKFLQYLIFRIKKQLLQNPNFIPKKFCINSGMLINSKVFGSLEFREDLFIDIIDFEFCLKVRDLGLIILQYKNKLMNHMIRINGKKEKTYHNLERLY